MKTTIVKGMAIVCGLLVVACSPGTPSEEQARSAVAAEMKEYGALIDFTKTNGEVKEITGQKYYIFHYSAATKLNDGWAWRKKDALHEAGIQRANAASSLFFAPTLTSIPTGATYVARGKVPFRQTEKGWAHDGVETNSYGFCQPGKSASECYASQWGKP